MPGNKHRIEWAGSGAVLLLLVSLSTLMSSPLLMPGGYDWIDHTTSESAAQGVQNAWYARTGFVAWGGAALLIALFSARTLPVRIALGLFGIGVMGAAAFPSRPWFDAPFNPTEDLAHTFCASLMGAAFIATSGLQALLSPGDERRRHAFACAIALLAPAVMAIRPDLAGLAQRAMFLVAYWWFYVETKRLLPPSAP